MDFCAKPFYLPREQVRWVEENLAQMSVRDKAGQLFCLLGTAYSFEELKKLVRDYNIGGILFRPAPTRDICSWFAALDEEARIPLLKAANLEEGGSGAATDATFFGWPMMVSATGDVIDMRRFSEVCAREGSQCGVNWTFSPVCDLDLNFNNPITNVRSCGSDAAWVKELCSVYVKTLQGFGMAACAKHFPGDGVDYRDQHLHPTYNSLSAKEWYDSYGTIYKRLIDDGLLSIMAGHIVQPHVEMELEPEKTFADCLPASLNKTLLNGVLRGEFGFNGVITTDATIMAGFTQAMERKKAIPAAIAAGCDMLVFSTDIYEDYDYMLSGIESGILSIERLDEAVGRILALKAKVCFSERVENALNALKWRDECADKSVTLVKNIGNAIPISKEKYDKIKIITLGNDNTPEGSMTGFVEKLLHEEGFVTERFRIDNEDLHGTRNIGRTLTLYLANLEHASNLTAVRIFWAKKHALDSPRYVREEDSIFVSFANPYHLQDVPRIKTYINAYSCNKSTIKAVVDKLLGKSPFRGKSPVDAFCGLPDTRL